MTKEERRERCKDINEKVKRVTAFNNIDRDTKNCALLEDFAIEIENAAYERAAQVAFLAPQDCPCEKAIRALRSEGRE